MPLLRRRLLLQRYWPHWQELPRGRRATRYVRVRGARVRADDSFLGLTHLHVLLLRLRMRLMSVRRQQQRRCPRHRLQRCWCRPRRRRSRRRRAFRTRLPTSRHGTVLAIEEDGMLLGGVLLEMLRRLFWTLKKFKDPGGLATCLVIQSKGFRAFWLVHVCSLSDSVSQRRFRPSLQIMAPGARDDAYRNLPKGTDQSFRAL